MPGTLNAKERRSAARRERASGERSSNSEHSNELSAREGEQAGERAAASDAPATRPDEPATIQPTPGGRPCYADLSSDVWLVLLEHHLDTRSLCAIARTCSFLAELTSSRRLWAGQFLRMFGDRNGSLLTNRYESAGADALAGEREIDSRRRCCVSEAALGSWRRLGAQQAAQLPLPDMTSVALDGERGLSTHGGRLVRLWAVRSGRRLSCHTLRHAPLCCHAAGDLGAVGDGSGAVHVYDLAADFEPTSRAALPIRPSSVLLLAAGTEASLVASGGEGQIALSRADGGVLLGLRALQPAVLVGASRELLDVSLAAAGERGQLYSVTADGGVHLLDTAQGLAAVWRSGGGGGDAADVDTLAHSFAVEATVAGGQPCRPVASASFSAGWRLLAASAAGGGVALWDARAPPSSGPAGLVRAEGRGGCVHLDDGGSCGGQLLLAPSGGPAILVYDVRRVGGSAPPPVVGSISLPAPHRLGALAADSRTLVCAGGAGSSCAFRWEPRRPGAEEAANDDDSLAGLSVGKQRKTKRERQGSRGDAATKVRGGQKERGTGRRGNAGSF